MAEGNAKLRPTGANEKKARELCKLMKKLDGTKEIYTTSLNAAQLRWLLDTVKSIFAAEPSLVPVAAPISICGDIHGQFSDLLRIFQLNLWPSRERYMFLGDYVDRGPHSIQTISFLFALKVCYPCQLFLLRGNHETKPVNRTYGFWDEIKANFQTDGDDKTFKDLFKAFNEVFDNMPLAGLISDRVLCMHGGLSPDLMSLDQIREIPKPLSEIPQQGLASDLLWADPDKTVKGFVSGSRGVSYLFGPDAVVDKCDLLGVDMIVRAHQVVPQGYEMFADGLLVTLFSAPDYCGKFANSGGVMRLDVNMKVSLKMIPSKTVAVPSASTSVRSTSISANTSTKSASTTPSAKNAPLSKK